MNLLKKRKGFTLVELCVVLAISVIVVALVLTTLLIFSNQNKKISNEAAFIGEVTVVQKLVNEWIKEYDSVNYTVTNIEGSGGLQAVIANTTTVAARLTFADNAITTEDLIGGTTSTTDKYVYINEIKFFDIVTFKEGSTTIKSEHVVRLDLTRKGSKNKVLNSETLLFPLMADTTRERGVTGRK